MDNSSKGHLERQTNDTLRCKKGPIATLAHRFAESPNVQRAAQCIPESAKPLLATVTEPVSRVAGAVDGTLTTREADRLSSTAKEFFYALAAFTLMLLAVAITKLEATFQVPPPSEDFPEISNSIPTSPHTFDTPRTLNEIHDDIPRNELYKKQARALFSRYISFVRSAIYKSRKSVTSKNDETASEDPNHEVVRHD